MGRIKDENYYVIKGWMLNKLGLKGTQLILYAIIHGFSQDDASQFKGSLSYLSEFAGVTYESCRNNLNELVKKGLITKEIGECGGVNYYKTKDIPIHEEVPKTAQKEPKISKYNDEIIEVIEYLNQKTGSKFRNTASSGNPIKSRLNEGFTVDDCKRVIDNKCDSWLSNEKMKVYLRPSTLFGNKFESYLNESSKKETASYKIDEYEDKRSYVKPQYKRSVE